MYVDVFIQSRVTVKRMSEGKGQLVIELPADWERHPEQLVHAHVSSPLHAQWLRHLLRQLSVQVWKPTISEASGSLFSVIRTLLVHTTSFESTRGLHRLGRNMVSEWKKIKHVVLRILNGESAYFIIATTSD